MNWPDNADGDALRQLAAENFDFSRQYPVEFKIDFSAWPPPPAAIAALGAAYPAATRIEPGSDAAAGDKGYLSLRINDTITYELIAGVQSEVTRLMKQYGGWCYSWGVVTD